MDDGLGFLGKERAGGFVGVQATQGTRFTQLQAPGEKTLCAACLFLIDG
jgi:hypothetical protein